MPKTKIKIKSWTNTTSWIMGYFMLQHAYALESSITFLAQDLCSDPLRTQFEGGMQGLRVISVIPVIGGRYNIDRAKPPIHRLENKKKIRKKIQGNCHMHNMVPFAVFPGKGLSESHSRSN